MFKLELSPKQQLTLTDSDARLNIWEGAVRSGKSYVSLVRWLKFVQTAPPGKLVMVGHTQDTIELNIVDPILDLIGADARHYTGKRELKLWKRTIKLVGASDQRAERKIQGPTFSGAYVDEITLIPEGFWAMLLSRLSKTGAYLFGTTNPDTPFHWLKRTVLDRKDELNKTSNHIKHWKFNLEDNPSLSEEYKNNLKAEYQGLWYRRYINGEWCLAEGAIYDFFDEELHCINFNTNLANYYIVGVDYGTSNPTAFTMIGYNPTTYPNMWVEKEYYYDSLKHFRQKTDLEYADDLKKFTKDHIIKDIYVDPSAESFKVECRRSGIRNIVDAKNDVIDGIRFVSGLITHGTLKIVKACKNLRREFQSYSWDSKCRELGVDKPLKRNDHLCDSLRYALFTHFGQNLGKENRLTKDRLKEMKRKYLGEF